MSLNACANLEEEELTVEMPVEVLPLRNISLVESYPPAYDPPIGRAVRNYIRACRRRARELREYERVQYSDALYQRCRSLMIRFIAHAKKNARYRPWEDYEYDPFHD